jgi:hypothetical protein
MLRPLRGQFFPIRAYLNAYSLVATCIKLHLLTYAQYEIDTNTNKMHNGEKPNWKTNHQKYRWPPYIRRTVFRSSLLDWSELLHATMHKVHTYDKYIYKLKPHVFLFWFWFWFLSQKETSLRVRDLNLPVLLYLTFVLIAIAVYHSNT